ncbi:MAG: lipoprotein insertase outer membrane protein LolB [Formosimonas sp.]
MRRLLILASLAISACTSLAPVRDANNPNDAVQFNMDARFGVQYIEDGKDKNLTGKMQWEETRRATDIILANPIGTSLASLHITRTEAVLKTANGDMFSEKTPEELLYRMLGYELPLSHMRQAIGSAQSALPEHRDYDVWHVQVLSRFSNPNLAKKLLITRQKPTPVSMTLMIDERNDAPNE